MKTILTTEEELVSLIQTSLRSIIREELSSLMKADQANSKTEFLSRKQVAHILGITLPTLNSYTKTGKVSAYRIGRRIRYKRNEVEKSLRLIRTGLGGSSDNQVNASSGVNRGVKTDKNDVRK
jgi:excisionase family DNA binding protein